MISGGNLVSLAYPACECLVRGQWPAEDDARVMVFVMQLMCTCPVEVHMPSRGAHAQ